MQQWYNWLFEVKKKDEEKRMEVEHLKTLSRLTDSSQGGAGLLHKITEPTVWRGLVQILKEEEQDAKPLTRCEEKRK